MMDSKCANRLVNDLITHGFSINRNFIRLVYSITFDLAPDYSDVFIWNSKRIIDFNQLISLRILTSDGILDRINLLSLHRIQN